MTLSMRLSDYAAMSPAEQAAALDALVNAARTNGATARTVLSARIRRFEERYEMTSDEMLQRVASGEFRETAEIAEWLFLLDSGNRGVAR